MSKDNQQKKKKSVSYGASPDCVIPVPWKKHYRFICTCINDVHLKSVCKLESQKILNNLRRAVLINNILRDIANNVQFLMCEGGCHKNKTRRNRHFAGNQS